MEVFEEIFNGLTPIFVAYFVPELFTCLCENSQRKQTIGTQCWVPSLKFFRNLRSLVRNSPEILGPYFKIEFWDLS